MDDLASALAGSFSVSNVPNTTAAPHPRYAQYKTKSNVPDQAERRRRILESQKKNRFDQVNHMRRLAENDWTSYEDEEDEEWEDVEEMECEVIKKPGRRYKNQLMLSEWMVEIPADFEQEWVLVNCPMGKRNLVVASRNSTKSYFRSGYLNNSFSSHLPGGKRGTHKNDYTILDCIYNELEKTYYILDVLCWASYPVMDSETEFRFFWLHQKYQEVPELVTISKQNQYKFVPVPNYPCTKENLTQVMAMPLPYELDGLLFYHKKAHYLIGATPLALWLKVYMVPEILGIPVPENLMNTKPNSYTTFEAHSDKVKERKEHRIKKEQAKSGDGDICSQSENEQPVSMQVVVQSETHSQVDNSEQPMDIAGKKKSRRRKKGKSHSQEVEMADGQEVEADDTEQADQSMDNSSVGI